MFYALDSCIFKFPFHRNKHVYAFGTPLNISYVSSSKNEYVAEQESLITQGFFLVACYWLILTQWGRAYSDIGLFMLYPLGSLCVYAPTLYDVDRLKPFGRYSAEIVVITGFQ
uniref:Uncharacterized protein n=1 Tax=Glyptapanteles indiensis TaxID=92994 RepID=B7S970_GLYIN|nr:hypothetical protein GIP_L8_0590 [Glyptapanteles indiensis]